MQTFRERFDGMLGELRAHPEVEIFAVEIRPPADPELLEIAELVLAQPLPAAMREFYAAHNGVFLEWGVRGLDYPDKTRPFRSPGGIQRTGCINLVPVEAAISKEWETGFQVGEVTAEQQRLLFGAVPDPEPPFRAACIDLFSSWSQGALIVGPEPLMIVTSDHGADLDSSNFLSFDVYLDITLALYGTSRGEVLGIGHSERPRRVTRCEWHPTLESILKDLKGP